MEERRKLEVLSHSLQHGISESTRESLQELSTCDNHPADLGSETFERGKDIGLLDNARRLLEQIDEAIERIDRGQYGWCSRCGRRIPEERLHAIPWASLCIECKHKEESGDLRSRPVEEQVVPMPAGRRPTNASPAYNGFDVWEELARYGTANSTQDEARPG